VAYPSALAYPSPNYQAGRTAAITHVVLHTTEHNLPESLSILTDPYRSDAEGGRVSAHYLVAPSGSVYQLVDDSDTAWTAGPANPYSINIEVVGSASDPGTWSSAVVSSLGQLAGWLSSHYSIPLVYRDDPSSAPLARGFVAHGALQPATRSDPGPWFPWGDVRAIADPSLPPVAGGRNSAEFLGILALVGAAAALAWSLTK